MTGKELIIYILQNDLLDTPVFRGERFLDFMTAKEAAVKFNVGESTVLCWVKLNMLPSIQIGGKIFIPKDATTSECLTESELKKGLLTYGK